MSSELLAALNAVRLCGTVTVIDAAEELVTAAGDLNLGERSAARFDVQARAVVAAQKKFLEVCREGLAYSTRWYQVIRHWKERRFLKRQAAR
ncbi:hypothetical protein [Streptomyces cinereoruber]|uniref:hypothetical protein n=1 Tax=Streptomyces cinereoruber TaxID=67260 RepID=UPI003624DE8B